MSFLEYLEAEGIAPCESVCSAGIDLAVCGVHVFPLVGKEPDGRLTPRGVLNATDDIRTIVRWFYSPTCTLNLGIAIGLGSLTNVAVLDTDPRHGGDERIAALVEKNGEIPETLTVETGRRDGGTHRYLSRPPGKYREKLCGARGGVEFLGRGKYVVAPPSLHPDTGHAYRVISAPHVGIAPAPEWLLALARVEERLPTPVAMPVASSVVYRARKYLAKCEPAISGSYGHDTTFLAALKLTRGFGLSVDDAYALISEWNQTCAPPWSAGQLRRKVEQAAQHGRMDLGALASARRRTA